MDKQANTGGALGEIETFINTMNRDNDTLDLIAETLQRVI